MLQPEGSLELQLAFRALAKITIGDPVPRANSRSKNLLVHVYSQHATASCLGLLRVLLQLRGVICLLVLPAEVQTKAMIV